MGTVVLPPQEEPRGYSLQKTKGPEAKMSGNSVSKSQKEIVQGTRQGAKGFPGSTPLPYCHTGNPETALALGHTESPGAHCLICTEDLQAALHCLNLKQEWTAKDALSNQDHQTKTPITVEKVSKANPVLQEP